MPFCSSNRRDIALSDFVQRKLLHSYQIAVCCVWVHSVCVCKAFGPICLCVGLCLFKCVRVSVCVVPMALLCTEWPCPSCCLCCVCVCLWVYLCLCLCLLSPQCVNTIDLISAHPYAWLQLVYVCLCVCVCGSTVSSSEGLNLFDPLDVHRTV